MTSQEFTARYPRYRTYIRFLARKLAGTGDLQLLEDLEQEGAYALWQVNLTLVRSNEDAMIRQAIKFRLIDVLRHLHENRYCVFETNDVLGDGGEHCHTNYDGYAYERPLFGGAEAVLVDEWEQIDGRLDCERLVQSLPRDDAELLSAVFGLEDRPRRTMRQVGDGTGISEAAVRYRRDQLLRILRKERITPLRKETVS